MNAVWTEEQVARLKELAAEGLSARQIAERLGENITRNAVIGQLHRRKIRLPNSCGPRATSKAKVSPKRAPNPTGYRGRPKLFRQSPKKIRPQPPPAIEDRVGPSLNVTILDLKPWQCRWPVNDPPRRGLFLFCGRPADGFGPYCDSHQRLSRGPGTPSERDVARLGNYLTRLA